MILVLSEPEVERLLPMEECIEVMADTLAALARGEMYQPLRSVVRPPDAPGLIGLMPAHRASAPAAFGLKAVNVMPGNPAQGLDAHQGAVLVSDGDTGELRAILNAVGDHRDPDRGRLGGRHARTRAGGRARARDPRRGRRRRARTSRRWPWSARSTRARLEQDGGERASVRGRRVRGAVPGRGRR